MTFRKICFPLNVSLDASAFVAIILREKSKTFLLKSKYELKTFRKNILLTLFFSAGRRPYWQKFWDFFWRKAVIFFLQNPKKIAETITFRKNYVSAQYVALDGRVECSCNNLVETIAPNFAAITAKWPFIFSKRNIFQEVPLETFLQKQFAGILKTRCSKAKT